MQELLLRKFHRYLGAFVAPLVLLQATSGLILSLDLLGRWQSQVRRFLEEVDLPALALFWDAVFYEIHFGSGAVGRLHNLAVGLSLVILVASGVAIFVKVVARTHFKAGAPARPAVTAPEQLVAVAETRGPVTRRGVALALGLAALGLMGLDVFIFSAAYRLLGLHLPHFYAASQIEIHTARSRAALERLLAGDPEVHLEAIEGGIARALRAADALLEKPEPEPVVVDPSREILPVENRLLRRRVEGVAQGLRRLGQQVAEPALRDALMAGRFAGGQVYRRALEGLEASAQGISEALAEVVRRDRERFFAIHLVLFLSASLFLLAVATVLYAFDLGRVRHLAAIRTAHDIARAYELRFRAVVRQAADPLVVLDRQGRLAAASLSAANLLGYMEEEFLALNIADFDSCSSAAEREALWAEVKPGAPVAMKSRWRRRDGEEVPVILSVASVVAEGEDTGGPLLLVQARLAGC